MKQYIDKDAVIVEINRVLNSYDPNEITSGRYALADLRDFLDTLEVKEVKEVNLDMEINLWVKNLHRVPNFEELNKFAKHFFELGLKAKGE